MPEITSAKWENRSQASSSGDSFLFPVPTPPGACFSPSGLTFRALPCFSTSPGREGRGGEGKGESRVCLSSPFIPWIRSRLCCLGRALKQLLASISSSPFCLRPPGKGNPGPARQPIPLCFRFPLLRPPGLHHPASGTAPAPPKTPTRVTGMEATRGQELVQIPFPALALHHPLTLDRSLPLSGSQSALCPMRGQEGHQAITLSEAGKLAESQNLRQASVEGNLG